jgi:hypothetical protein
MNILISIPIGWYQSLLGRCLLSSREYAVLKNSVIDHVPSQIREGNIVEILCSVDDAKLILDLANRMYIGAPFPIEQPMALKLDPVATLRRNDPFLRHPPAEYRMKPSGETWHFCVNCTQWPTEDFIAVREFPTGSGQICNECIVKDQHGEGA